VANGGCLIIRGHIFFAVVAFRTLSVTSIARCTFSRLRFATASSTTTATSRLAFPLNRIDRFAIRI
jgi:hypothetical protein